jgi:aminopeptidase N
LWLNEGFATYMEYLGTFHSQEKYSGVFDEIVIQAVQPALERGNMLYF